MELKESDFQKISRLVYEQCGINLHDGKKELVKARLGKRLRRGNFSSFSDYYRYVTTAEGQDELVMMIDSLSTNLTYFFRESGHFRKLRSVLPDMAAVRNEGRKNARLQIWSAGCSSGEEPYSLAIILHEACLRDKSMSGTIYATDIDHEILSKAKQGVYEKNALENLSELQIKRHFTCLPDGTYEIKPHLRTNIRFLHHDLMKGAPVSRYLDIITCRNVTIYFTENQKSELLREFHGGLLPGGYYIMGLSEYMGKEGESFFRPYRVQQKIYTRI